MFQNRQSWELSSSMRIKWDYFSKLSFSSWLWSFWMKKKSESCWNWVSGEYGQLFTRVKTRLGIHPWVRIRCDANNCHWTSRFNSSGCIVSGRMKHLISSLTSFWKNFWISGPSFPLISWEFAARLPSELLFSLMVEVLMELFFLLFLSSRIESNSCTQVSRLDFIEELRWDFKRVCSDFRKKLGWKNHWKIIKSTKKNARSNNVQVIQVAINTAVVRG